MLEILPDEPVKAGEIVAHRYRLDRVVGEGGMGIVWAATHVLTEKPCALKFLKAGRASDPRSHARLLHEARATCRVRHPNVAPVHDILELPNGVPFIVMDLLDGEPLSARLRRGSLDWTETLEILVPTADAIMAAHEHGVVHRDLKPDNVFLETTSDGGYEVKVLDFGIAKRFDTVGEVGPTDDRTSTAPTTHGLTTTNSMVGTPSYMAPEQIRLEADVGTPADVWMLGMLAYECLVGRRPERDPLTHGVDDRLAEHALATEARGANGAVIAFVLGMLALEPSARPSLAELRQSMRALGVGTSTPRRPPTFALIGAFLLVLGATAFAVERAGARPARATGARATETPTTTPPSMALASAAATAAVDVSTSSTASANPSATAAPKRTRRAHTTTSTPASAPPSSSVTIPSYDRQ